MEKEKRCVRSKHRIRYTEEFQLELCLEYLRDRFTQTELQNKYGIKGKSCLLTWLTKLGYIAQNSTNYNYMSNRKIKVNGSERKKDIKNELENAWLKTKIYSKIIEIEEQKY